MTEAACAEKRPIVKGDWWKLVSGRTVSVRKLETVDGQEVATVRYVDEGGALSCGDFCLRTAFLARGTKVGHD